MIVHCNEHPDRASLTFPLERVGTREERDEYCVRAICGFSKRTIDVNSSSGTVRPLCCSCKQGMKIGATKCHACGTDQRLWQRALVTLGALAAVSSLATLAVEQVYGRLVSHGPDIVGAVVGLDDNQIHFSVSNQGDRVGTLMDAIVEVNFPESSCERLCSSSVRLKGENLRQVLDVGKTASITAQPVISVRLPLSFAPEALSDPKYQKIVQDHQSCKLLLTYVDHKSAFRQKALPFACIPSSP